MRHFNDLLRQIEPETGTIPGVPGVARHLSDLRGCFFDTGAYERALAADDPLVYTVTSIETGSGGGDLHYAVGALMPGRVGAEYFMTRGHLHAWREAAEIYMGLRGEGHMLLEDVVSGESRFLPLCRDAVVYVPGSTAHRTINTGSAPLIYVGVYPAKAGHDYDAVAENPFQNVIVEKEKRPVMIDRVTLVQ